MSIELITVMIIAGLAVGGLGHHVMAGGYGPAADVVLGVAGSVVTGALFRVFGLGLDAGWAPLAAASCMGAIGALLFQRTLAPSERTSGGRP